MESGTRVINWVSACAALLALGAAKATTHKPRTTVEFFEEMCNLLANYEDENESQFEIKLLRGSWLVEFAWNFSEEPYPKMIFFNVIPQVVARFKSNMGKYLKKQPNWDQAVLLMITFNARERHVLLFKDEDGPPGRFLGVPDFIQFNPFANIPKKSVDMFKMQATFSGLNVHPVFLVLTDCHTGETSISRRDEDLQPNFAPLIYQAAFKVPFPLRYSHLYTGVTYPDIPIPRGRQLLFEYPNRYADY